MAIAIRTDSPQWKEIVAILHQFADHAAVCDVCNVKTGAHCDIGGRILHELTKFEDVKEVPEDWKSDSRKPL